MSFFSFSFFAEVTPSACTPDKLKYSLTSVAMEPATSDLLLQLVYEDKHVFSLSGCGRTQTITWAKNQTPKFNTREFGNRQRRRRKTKSLIRVVYKSAHTLLDFNCLLKYQSFI